MDAELVSAAEIDPLKWRRTIDLSNDNDLYHFPSGYLLADRYLIERRTSCACAGIGNIYSGYDKANNDRKVTIQDTPSWGLTEYNRDDRLKEAIAMMQRVSLLNHPNIVPLLDFFYFDNKTSRAGMTIVQISEYIDGDTMEDIVRQREKPSEPLIVKWAMDICEAFNYLHAQQPLFIYGRSHHYFSVDCVIDNSNGQIKLQALTYEINRYIIHVINTVGQITGGWGYLAPEVGWGGRVEARTDIYMLGALLFRLVTGLDPHDNPLLIFDFAKNPRPRKLNPAISEGLEAIICKAVAFKPAERFDSALQMKSALADHLTTLAIDN